MSSCDNQRRFALKRAHRRAIVTRAMPSQFQPMYYVLVPVALVAGFVRGFSGFGGPMIMLPVLNAFFAPAATIWVVMWTDIFVNLRLVPESWRHASRAVVIPLIVGSVLAMPLGVAALVYADPAIMKKVISATILLAALILLIGWRSKREHGAAAAFGVGALSGAILGATSIAVATALFLNSGKQSAGEARANFIVWGFVASIALLAMIGLSQPLKIENLQTIAVLAPLYLLGAVAGTRVHHHIDPRYARTGVLLLIMAVAVTGLVR